MEKLEHILTEQADKFVAAGQPGEALKLYEDALVESESVTVNINLLQAMAIAHQSLGNKKLEDKCYAYAAELATKALAATSDHTEQTEIIIARANANKGRQWFEAALTDLKQAEQRVRKMGDGVITQALEQRIARTREDYFEVTVGGTTPWPARPDSSPYFTDASVLGAWAG